MLFDTPLNLGGPFAQIVNLVDQFVHGRNKVIHILVDSVHLHGEPHEENDEGDQGASAPESRDREIGDC